MLSQYSTTLSSTEKPKQESSKKKENMFLAKFNDAQQVVAQR
jgi:hypothetical protein